MNFSKKFVFFSDMCTFADVMNNTFYFYSAYYYSNTERGVV